MKNRRNNLARALIWIVVPLCLCLLCGLPTLVGYSGFTNTSISVGTGFFDFTIVPAVPASPSSPIGHVQLGQPYLGSTSGTYCVLPNMYRANLGGVQMVLLTCNQWAVAPPPVPTVAMPLPQPMATVILVVPVPTVVPTVQP